MCYNIPTTYAIGQKPIATQKKISYYHQSPARLLSHRWYSVIGSLAGLCFWDEEVTRGIHLTQETFIEQARRVHGDKFSYELVNYQGPKSKVLIICSTHGKFSQYPRKHLEGQGCPTCAYDLKSTMHLGFFLQKSIQVHGDIYDYSKVDCSRYRSIVTIICKRHGEFEQTAANHIKGKGCPICGIAKNTLNRTLTTEQFTERARIIHGDLYDYNQVIYQNDRVKVAIGCKIHGVFFQTPSTHLQGRGCPICRFDTIAKKLTLTTDEFIRKAKEVHGNLFDYSQVNYKSSHQKIIIICRIHGEFEQTPNSHLNGRKCPFCIQSYGEEKVAEFLRRFNILYKRQKTFPGCSRNNKLLHFDFYFTLDSFRFLVEYDGIQHFEPVPRWGGKKNLEETQTRDRIKDQFAKDNEIILIRIPYSEKRNISGFLQSKIETYLGKSLAGFLAESPKSHNERYTKTNFIYWGQLRLL